MLRRMRRAFSHWQVAMKMEVVRTPPSDSRKHTEWATGPQRPQSQASRTQAATSSRRQLIRTADVDVVDIMRRSRGVTTTVWLIECHVGLALFTRHPNQRGIAINY